MGKYAPSIIIGMLTLLLITNMSARQKEGIRLRIIHDRLVAIEQIMSEAAPRLNGESTSP